MVKTTFINCHKVFHEFRTALIMLNVPSWVLDVIRKQSNIQIGDLQMRGAVRGLTHVKLTSSPCVYSREDKQFSVRYDVPPHAR